MPDRHHRRLGWALLVMLAVPALFTTTAPAIVLAAPPVNEKECAGPSLPPAAAGGVCKEGLDLGGVVPIVGAVLAGSVLALVATFLVLRRRASGPFASDPSEWWLCPTCGSTNVQGSPRCYKCGTWQR